MTEPAASGRRARLLALVLGAGAIAVLALLFLRRGRIEPGLLRPKTAAAPNARVEEVLLQTVPRMRNVVGSVQSRVEVDAASRVMATVREVRVRAGDRVKAGEVLVVLDSGDLKGALSSAEGALSAANANLARAAKDEQRFKELIKRGSVTAHEFDAVEAAWRAAVAEVAAAKGRVETARAALSYAVVTSPLTGLVDEREIEPGDLALPGRPLVRLYDPSALRVELRIPEELTRSISVGSEITVHVEAAGLDIGAVVNEIVPATDPASRTFLARAPLAPNPALRPGMFGRASVAAGGEKVLTVARSAVEGVGQLDTVRLLKDGAVQMRQITIGRTFGDRVEVLSGLEAGDRVFLDTRDSGGHE